MDAVEVIARKQTDAAGRIIEIVIWLVPVRVPGSLHRYKYRLFFGDRGRRIIGYDNERGKGDHKHVEGRETAYNFVSLDQLLRDFEAEVTRWKARP